MTAFDKKTTANLMKFKILGFFTLFLLIFSIYSSDFLEARLTIENLKTNQLFLDNFVVDHTAKAIFAYIFCYVIICVLLLPGAALLTLAAGSLFGTAQGFFIAIFSSTIGATLTLVVYRNFFATFLQGTKKAAIVKISKFFSLDKPISLLYLRLIPLIPFNALNMAMSLTEISKKHFFFHSFAGMLPATYIVVRLGNDINSVRRMTDILDWKFLISFSLLGALLLGGLIAKNILLKKTN